MEVYRASAWRQIITGEVFVGGSWRTITTGESYIGGTWRRIATFVQPLTLAITPTTVYGSGTGAIGRVYTDPVTATPTGGLGPFTYSWTIPAGSGGATATTPASASTTISALMNKATTINSYATCVVTDSLGTVSAPATGNFALDN